MKNTISRTIGMSVAIMFLMAGMMTAVPGAKAEDAVMDSKPAVLICTDGEYVIAMAGIENNNVFTPTVTKLIPLSDWNAYSAEAGDLFASGQAYYISDVDLDSLINADGLSILSVIVALINQVINNCEIHLEFTSQMLPTGIVWETRTEFGGWVVDAGTIRSTFSVEYVNGYIYLGAVYIEFPRIPYAVLPHAIYTPPQPPEIFDLNELIRGLIGGSVVWNGDESLDDVLNALQRYETQ
jgi:hypothetical protein